jgi:hypothetical protein
LYYVKCCNPSFGFVTKTKAYKVTGQKRKPGNESKCAGMNPHIPKRASTLKLGLPPWELESRWTHKCAESNCRGQNPMDWKVLYTIGKMLKLKCLKWARMIHLDIWNTSYGQKKGRESNWQFDSWSLKVGNWTHFLACRWCATYHWKVLNKGYNFVSDLVSIKGLHTKLWGPKIIRVPTLRISRLPFGSPMTKCHLDVGLMERHRVYYKGEGGGFP